jgi:S1-C subfamily serine protease
MHQVFGDRDNFEVGLPKWCFDIALLLLASRRRRLISEWSLGGSKVIQKTLATTQLATFSVQLPDKKQHGMPTPAGTGFFVSPDGWFVTAAHVIAENGRSEGPVRSDLDQIWLMKETRVAGGPPGAMC